MVTTNDRSATDVATSAARETADSEPMSWIARAGLTSRGLIYLLMGVIALLVARGKHAEVDQRGALTQVARQPFGTVLVAAMAAGFLCYALWRLSEAAFGAAGEGRKAGPRIQSLVRGLAYLVLAGSALALLLGSRTSQRQQQGGLTARVMEHTGGRPLIFVLGLVVVGVGLFLAWEGISRSFMKHFPRGQTSEATRNAIEGVGAFGTTARGLVFALVGCLLVSAAWTFEPAKAGGLDVAIKTLRDGPGGFVLVLAAIGLIAFGVYGLAEARYRRV